MEQRLILDRYRPLAHLREGDHGSVLVAYDTRMARRVAIKRLPLPIEPGGRPSSRRGLQEARLAALLNHPNIVTVHEWDTDSGDAYLIMELVDGASLATVLDRLDAALDLDEAAAILEDVAAAISFAHANGVLHLDLKPDNVLITRDGRAKVADFGVAALTGLGGRASGTGGTLGYMPIEQLVGDPLDERTDVWALGSLMYEALTCSNPFDADTVDEAILKIEFMDASPPSRVGPDLMAGIDEPIMTALAVRRADRFDDITEFAEELESHLGDPKAGRRSLAAIVGDLAEDAVPDQPYEGVGLWDRLIVQSSVLRRISAVVASTWMAWLGSSALGITSPVRLATVAIIAGIAAFTPGLGLAVGLIGISLGTWVGSGPALGLAVALPLSVYWTYLGRRGSGSAMLPLFAPVFAIGRMALALPLLLGFAFTPGIAALSGGLSAAAIVLCSAATGHAAPYLEVDPGFVIDPWKVATSLDGVLNAFSDPVVYVVIAGWAIAAAAMSLMCGPATRVGAGLGMIAGFGWLLLGYLMWSVMRPAIHLTGPTILWQTVGSLILMTLVIAAGPPARGEP